MRETGLELAYPVTVSELGQSQAFSSIGSYSMSGLNFGSERPERLRAAAVTPGLLAALDLQPALGRAFTDRDVKQMQRIAIVSHKL